MNRTFLVAAFVAGVIIFASPAFAADDKPSAMMCWIAKSALAEASGNVKAAEDLARSRGASEADIAKAHRCKR